MSERTLERPAPALRRHRRRRHERPRDRRARARGGGDRLRPRARLAVPGAQRADRRPACGRERPDGAELVVLERDPGGQPGARGGPRARAARAPPRRPARRDHATAADDRRRPARTARRRRRAWSCTRCAAAASIPATWSAARCARPGSNAGWGTGEWLVVEADESDRSLLKLAPRIAVLTNAELDHHATYSSQRDVDDTFRAFLALAEEIVLGDEPALTRFPGRVARPEGVRARAGRLALQRRRRGRDAAGAGRPQRAQRRRRRSPPARSPAPTRPRPPPRWRTSAAPAGGSSSSARRAAGALVVDDYAHHPTEVRATIAAARTLAPRRVVAVFQPHLFSRTRHQYREFGAALAEADLVAGARRLPGARARRGLPGRDRPARGRGGRRRGRRAARRAGCRGSTRPRRSCAPSCGWGPAADAGRRRRRRARAAVSGGLGELRLGRATVRPARRFSPKRPALATHTGV